MISNFMRVYRSRNLLQVSEKMLENRRMKIYYRSGALKVSSKEKYFLIAILDNLVFLFHLF